MRLFVVFDVKAKSVLGPVFPARSDGEAKRIFGGLAKAAETLPSQYPDDFVLYEVGELDDRVPIIVACEPVSHGTAREVLDAS